MKPDNNIMVVLSSPSGAGKTTITKKIQQKLNSFKISVSHTTRKPRLNEIDGVDYNFIDTKTFEKKIKENFFYEYAKIFDNYYGTSKIAVNNITQNNDIIFDIDWQGNQQLSKFGELNLLKIFITIKSKKNLKERLISRNQDSKSEIEKRLNSFDLDVKHWRDYDYIVTNENLENCFRHVESIILNHKRFNYPFS
jgi:guanylate kinase